MFGYKLHRKTETIQNLTTNVHTCRRIQSVVHQELDSKSSGLVRWLWCRIPGQSQGLGDVDEHIHWGKTKKFLQWELWFHIASFVRYSFLTRSTVQQHHKMTNCSDSGGTQYSFRQVLGDYLLWQVNKINAALLLKQVLNTIYHYCRWFF